MNKRHERFALEFFNQMTGKEIDRVEDLPPCAIDILARMDYEYIIIPLICQDLENGWSQTRTAIKYGVDRQVVRNIRTKYRITFTRNMV